MAFAIAVDYPPGAWAERPVTARTLYRCFRRAARLEAQGGVASAELARRMRLQAFAAGLDSGLPIDRIYFAATHSS